MMTNNKGDDIGNDATDLECNSVIESKTIEEIEPGDQQQQPKPSALSKLEEKLIGVDLSNKTETQDLEMQKDVANGERSGPKLATNGYHNDGEVVKASKAKMQEEPTQNQTSVSPKRTSSANQLKLREKSVRQGWMRHIIAILALSSIVLANMNRQAFNQALVSMTRHPTRNSNATTDNNRLQEEANQTMTTTTSSSLNYTTTTTAQPLLEVTTLISEVINESHDEKDDRFDWSSNQIGLLQAAFSLGYTPFMIPGGRLSEIYGAKWIIFLSSFGSALCCILSPFFADTNFYLLAASRVVMGLSQTGVSPALYALLVRWVPPDESSVYLPMIKVGVVIGFMSGSLVSGFTHWRHTFYLVGLLGMLWSTMWAIVATSDPRDNRYISKRELDFVEREIRRANKGRKQSIGASRGASAPWLKIFLNPVVLAFTLCKFTVKLSTDAQTMQIPMYLRNVFHVDKKLNSVLSATNFAIQGTFTGAIAYTAKEMIVKKSYGLSKTEVRRLFQGMCNFGMALAYILITFNLSSLEIVIAAIVFLSVAAMFGAGGEAVTPVDLSLEYSATIMAIANSGANLSGLILPTVVAKVLGEEKGSAFRWNLVWWIVAGIMSIGGLAYTIVVTAELQDFRTDDKKQDVEEGENEEAIEMKSSIKR